MEPSRRPFRGAGGDPPIRRQMTRREQIRRAVGHQDTQTSKRHLLKMIVSTLQPLEITEDSNFKAFVRALNPTLEIPSKRVVLSQLLGIYSEKKKELRSILSSADDIVLTCELWSPRAEDSYLTVGCHFVDVHGNLKSYTLKTTSLLGEESAANIQSQLSAVMRAWGLQEKVHYVVRAGMPQLKHVKAKWTHMPCFADTLDVMFKDLMNDDELSSVLRKCQNIIRFFKNDSEAEEKLREIQKQLNVEQAELVVYTGDRWLPWLKMLRRLLHQYTAMVMVFDQRGKTDLILSAKDKEKIKNIISALEPLEEATSTMKKEGFEAISAMLPLLKKLMDNLRDENRANDVVKMLMMKCTKKFGDINNHHLALITFLDPRFKNQLGHQNQKRATEELKKELGAVRPASSAANVSDLLDRYLAYEPTAELSNPLAWWRHTGNKRFAPLSKLALKRLGVVSTAVPLERAFSGAGDQFCSLRRTIEPENLDMILFLHRNWSSEPETQIRRSL